MTYHEEHFANQLDNVRSTSKSSYKFSQQDIEGQPSLIVIDPFVQILVNAFAASKARVGRNAWLKYSIDVGEMTRLTAKKFS